MNTPADRPLFIAQDKLTQWEADGKVTVTGTVLMLVAEIGADAAQIPFASSHVFTCCNPASAMPYCACKLTMSEARFMVGAVDTPDAPLILLAVTLKLLAFSENTSVII